MEDGTEEDIPSIPINQVLLKIKEKSANLRALAKATPYKNLLLPEKDPDAGRHGATVTNLRDCDKMDLNILFNQEDHNDTKNLMKT